MSRMTVHLSQHYHVMPRMANILTGEKEKIESMVTCGVDDSVKHW